ncbi:Vacuolar protein sorting-associated protein 20 2, partial [Tetrabaena socialis]
INLRLERHGEVARQLAAEGRRDRALLALRKKKLSEKQLEQLHGLLLNVEGMLSNIETTKKQTAVFTALQQSNATLKQLQAQVRLEDVQRLLDDTAEARQYGEELAALLGQQLTDGDDAEVEAELSALEEVVLDEEQLAMPKAPATKVPEAEKAAAARAAAQPQEEARQAQGSAAEEEEEQAEPAGTRQREAMLAS